MKDSDEPQEKPLDNQHNAKSEHLSPSGSPNTRPEAWSFVAIDIVRPVHETVTEGDDLADTADEHVADGLTLDVDQTDQPKPLQVDLVQRQTKSILKQAGSTPDRIVEGEVKRTTVRWDPRESIKEIYTVRKKRLRSFNWYGPGPLRRHSRKLCGGKNLKLDPNSKKFRVLTTLFYIMNIVFLASGFFFIMLGAEGVVGHSCMATLFNADWRSGVGNNYIYVLMATSISILVAGVLMMLVSAVGLYGLYRASSPVLNIYSVLLLIILLSKLAAVGLVYYFERSLITNITDQLLKALQANYEGYNSKNPISRAFDFAHAFFGCCGMKSWRDFQSTAWNNSENRTYQLRNVTVHCQFPITCCQLKATPYSRFTCSQLWHGKRPPLTDPQCPLRVPSRDNPYTAQPCIRPIRTFLVGKFMAMYYVTIAISVMELVSFNFAREFLGYLR